MKETIQEVIIEGLRLQWVRKRMKSVRIGVYPPDGRVRVATPRGFTESELRAQVMERMEWIETHRKKLIERYAGMTDHLETGEIHYFEGEKRRLRILESGKAGVFRFLENGDLGLQVKAGASLPERKKALQKAYRDHLSLLLPELIRHWSLRLGVEVREFGIRRMRTRWGSCNIREKRVWLSLELAKHPISHVEYVVVHELVHLLEPSHNHRFKKILGSVLPDWKILERSLREIPFEIFD